MEGTNNEQSMMSKSLIHSAGHAIPMSLNEPAAFTSRLTQWHMPKYLFGSHFTHKE